MNKHKICSTLLNSVSVLSNSKHDIFVLSSNFDKTKKFLIENRLSFIPYRFANCFNVQADFEDISVLSLQNDISFIQSNPIVMAEKQEMDLIKIENLCVGKYYGQGQTICFIDTGIYPHFDFLFPKNRLIKFIDLINNQTIPYDDNGHGTFVAGVACGNGIFNKGNKGFAHLANIICIKALSNKGDSNCNKILDAMQWVFENHKAYNISVVCMSFGAESINNSDPLSKGAEALWKRGITIVAAAGNSGPKKSTIKSPGNNPNIITVGALDELSMRTAEFSSRGPTIYGKKPDLLAPAVNITSCFNSTPPYTQMSGTSVATPIVAGICAILKSRFPNITNHEIKQYLLTNCKKITGDVDSEGAGYISFD